MPTFGEVLEARERLANGDAATLPYQSAKASGEVLEARERLANGDAATLPYQSAKASGERLEAASDQTNQHIWIFEEGLNQIICSRCGLHGNYRILDCDP